MSRPTMYGVTLTPRSQARVCMGKHMAARLQRPKMPAVTLGTRYRLKAQIQAPILATEHQLGLRVRRHMQGIRCQLKPQLRRPLLFNLRRQRT